MKKLISSLLIFIIIASILPVPVGYTGGASVKMYAPDEREIIVPLEEIEEYMKVGWYKEPVVTLYSSDGRELVVKTTQKEAYTSVGWFDAPLTTLYAPGGREIKVKASEASEYINVGWYTEPVTLVYSRDGRSLAVLNRELEAYKSVGWYDNLDTISKLMISPGGEETRIFIDHYAYYFSLGYRFKGRENIDITKPMVALTFDDGPGKETMRIVSCLVAYDSRATFFCVGENVDAMRATVRSVMDYGMEIGNHTYYHPDLAKLKPEDIAWQIDSCSQAIYSATGVYPTLFRPPYGSTNDDVLSVAKMPSIHWQIDTLDWETRDAKKTVESILSSVKDGDIILMHDLYEETADAVEIVVPKLLEAGFQLVTVSELAHFKNKTLEKGMKYRTIR